MKLTLPKGIIAPSNNRMPLPTIVQQPAGDWLELFKEYVNDSETPKVFWEWAGIFTIGAVLRRRVYFKWMRKKVFPNLYVIITGEPGSRKDPAVSLVKDMLDELSINQFANSFTRRSVTKELNEIQKLPQSQVIVGGKLFTNSECALVSTELSSALGTDLLNVILFLTDAWDGKDVYKHSTSEHGSDALTNVCISLLAATTPDYLMRSIPPDVVGNGFTSRVIFPVCSTRDKWRAFVEYDDTKYLSMIKDLKRIYTLSGVFKMTDLAIDFVKNWYEKDLRKIWEECQNKLTKLFLKRIQENMFKVAMILQVSKSNELIIDIDVCKKAIELLLEVADGATEAFDALGASREFRALSLVREVIKNNREVTPKTLLFLTMKEVGTIPKLMEALNTLMCAGEIELIANNSRIGFSKIIWKDKKK